MDTLLRKNQELTSILDVSRVLTSSFDLEHNLYAAMEILATNLEMQRGCVFLLDSRSSEIRIVTAYGLSTEEIRRGIYKIGEGIVGQVIESGAPMFIPNIGDEPKFLNKTHSRPRKTGISFLCIPIALDRETLGVLTVDRIYTEAQGNVDDDLRVLHIVASLIAQFVKLWNHYRQTQQECGDLRSRLQERYSLPNIIGDSAGLNHALKAVQKVAATDTTVLLLGESGTGKELIAKTLHYQSDRADHPFVAVNLAALPENLIEAELFGVEKGAYTGAAVRRAGRFESADNGTLFLDEIGELPLPLQVKLLRVLQEHTFERVGSSDPIRVNVRVVAATNRDLFAEVGNGRFREDLYWRLNVVPIVLPPLRERKSDIPLLINHYMKQFNKQYGRQVQLSPGAMAAMQTYAWPGNVRELANLMERLVIMAESTTIHSNDLPFHCIPEAAPTVNDKAVEPSTPGISLISEVEQLEKKRINEALKANYYVIQNTALALGVTPRQLGYRIQKYGIALKKVPHPHS
ncbi:MAG: sigma 54-interacting transcriptional regulator [Thermodesulfobacteriota bacterium]|nr:sigma 54-interacting transcriptional regulator [Thermodesulfobacteriota bacterium]